MTYNQEAAFSDTFPRKLNDWEPENGVAPFSNKYFITKKSRVPPGSSEWTFLSIFQGAIFFHCGLLVLLVTAFLIVIL